MTLNDIMKMTPEEFAASWEKDDEIIHTCYDALGVRFEKIEDDK